VIDLNENPGHLSEHSDSETEGEEGESRDSRSRSRSPVRSEKSIRIYNPRSPSRESRSRSPKPIHSSSSFDPPKQYNAYYRPQQAWNGYQQRPPRFNPYQQQPYRPNNWRPHIEPYYKSTGYHPNPLPNEDLRNFIDNSSYGRRSRGGRPFVPHFNRKNRPSVSPLREKSNPVITRSIPPIPKVIPAAPIPMKSQDLSPGPDPPSKMEELPSEFGKPLAEKYSKAKCVHCDNLVSAAKTCKRFCFDYFFGKNGCSHGIYCHAMHRVDGVKNPQLISILLYLSVDEKYAIGNGKAAPSVRINVQLASLIDKTTPTFEAEPSAAALKKLEESKARICIPFVQLSSGKFEIPLFCLPMFNYSENV
jgi:hypothetical protein